MTLSRFFLSFTVLAVSGSAFAQSKGGDKLNLCHATGNGKYIPLSVNLNALDGHMGHGDALQPNGLVPGSPGHVFNAACNAVTWTYGVNTLPDISAFDPLSPGNLYQGSGNPGTNFAVARSTAEGIELGLRIHYRQGPTVASADNFDDGVLHFNVASGPQSTANGSFAGSLGHAAWSYTFSIATGLSAATDLTDHTFQLLYDVDPGPGVIYRTLTLEAEGTPQAPGQSGFQWRDQGTGTVFILDDEGTSQVTQNSHNYTFGIYQFLLTSPYGPGSGFAGPATFDIILRALDGAQVVVSNHIVVDVAAAP